MRYVKPAWAAGCLAAALLASPAAGAFERLQTQGRRLRAQGDWLLVSAPEIERVALYDTHGERPLKLLEFGGEQGHDAGFLMGPHGALAVGDELVVVDTFNQRLQGFDLNDARAGRRPSLRRTRGRPGSGPGEFATPVSGLAVSSAPELAGLLFVADTGNRRVQVFDREWRFVRAWDVAEGDARPADIAFDARGLVLYVAEAGAARVTAFDARSGARMFDFRGCPDPALAVPAGLAVAPDGDLLVTDRVNRRLLRLRPERGPGGAPRGLRCVGSFGRYGSGAGEWQYPQAVAADARGRIYVCDQADDRCQAFDAEGRFLFAFADDWHPPEWTPPVSAAAPDDGRPRRLCSGAGTYGLRVGGAAGPLARDEPATLAVELTRGCGADAPPASDDLELRVTGWMPEHGHGLTSQPRVVPAGPGRFHIEGLRLQMSGHWELHFDLFRERGASIERAQWDLELP